MQKTRLTRSSPHGKDDFQALGSISKAKHILPLATPATGGTQSSPVPLSIRADRQRGHIPIPPSHALCTSHLHLCSEHNACASPRCIFTRICHNKNAALVLACLHEPSASSLLIKTRSSIAHRNKTGVLVGCGWLCVRVGNFSPEFCRN